MGQEYWGHPDDVHLERREPADASGEAMITNQYTYNGDGQRVQIVDSQGTKKPAPQEQGNGMKGA